MSIAELITTGAQVNLTISAVDLKEFALSLIAEARRLESEMPKVDRELTVQETAEQLGVSVNSLWRWEKNKYFIPHARVGHHPIYLQSQIDELKQLKTKRYEK